MPGVGERLGCRFDNLHLWSGSASPFAGSSATPNLDERIVDAVQDHRFDPGNFDVVIAWQLLEHLPRPDRALSRFCDALDDGGLLVLGLPNVLSVKGLLTQFTPHRFHVWVYRQLTGNSEVGTGDTAPFPTFLRFPKRG